MGADRRAELTELIGDAILAERQTDAEIDHLAIVTDAAAAESVTRDLLAHAVAAARADGRSWASIGRQLGLTRQAVQQRFGGGGEPEEQEDVRWLGPVTAFDEMKELDLAGRMGWRTIDAGILKHRMRRTDTQWEHRRVIWVGSLERYERDGWELGCRAFPWVYLVRDLGIPAGRPADPDD